MGGHVLDLASTDDHSESGKWARGMDGELTKVIEEFMRAVDLEALRFAKRGHRSLRARSGQVWDGPLSLEPRRAFWNSLRGAEE